MPFYNFDNRHFSAAEKTALANALNNLEAAISGKTAILTPQERQQYGSINEQNKLIVNKIKDYRDNNPALSCGDVDWVEFMNDFETRSVLQAAELRLQGLMEGIRNAKLLHDWDNYQASLTDYEYSKFKAGSSTTNGYSAKVDEIKQFFNRTDTQKSKDQAE